MLAQEIFCATQTLCTALPAACSDGNVLNANFLCQKTTKSLEVVKAFRENVSTTTLDDFCRLTIAVTLDEVIEVPTVVYKPPISDLFRDFYEINTSAWVDATGADLDWTKVCADETAAEADLGQYMNVAELCFTRQLCDIDQTLCN